MAILTFVLLTIVNCKIKLREHPKTVYVSLNSSENTDSRISVAVSNRFCAFTANLLIPVIEQGVVNHTFPSQTMDHITVDSMRMDFFSIAAFNLRFAYPDAQNLTLQAIDVALSIPETRFEFKYGVFTCKGTFSTELNKTSVSLNSKPYILHNGSLRLELEDTEITWGNMDIHHKSDGFLCNVEESIAQLFIGEINKFAEKNVREKLPKILASEFKTRAEEFLWSIPSHFYELNMTKDRLYIEVDLLPDTLTQRRNAYRRLTSPLLSPSALRQFPSRDIVVGMPSASINHYLQRAQRRNLLNFTLVLPPGFNSTTLRYILPHAYRLCPNCPLAIMMAATKGPQVKYSANTKGDFYTYNNSLEMIIRDARFSVVMLADIPEKEAAVTKRTTTSRPFDVVLIKTMKQAKQHFEHYSTEGTRFEKSMDASLNTIPLALFSVDFVMGVANARFDGSCGNELSLDVLPLRDLNITLLETNMGPLNTTAIRNWIFEFVNFLIIPMFYTHNWLKLPILDGLINISDQDLIVGGDISFF
ncbi:unnamed protein product [Phytomonas sp. EM1]|nr:unnamed protein product [Phytomonas sp. EM1]|eukprot:CCW59850.1 unnamed protein product [Phytomonas sp. isolate EM1]